VAYAAAYSESTLRVAAGEFSGSLSNGGESIGLTSPEGDVQRFTYDDENPWPESPDGVGTALVLAIPTSNDGDGRTNREEQIWGLDPTDCLPKFGRESNKCYFTERGKGCW